MTKRRVTPYDDHIPPDLWVQFPRADLRLRLIEAVLTIARLRGATSLDVQEALSVKWDRPSDDFGLRRTLGKLSEYDLAHTTVQPIVLHQKIGLFRLTERGRSLARALGVEPIDNGWDTLVRTHQGAKQVRHAALLLYTERLARERGWLTELTPPDGRAGYFPDLWINADDEWSMDVEVEGRWWAHSHHWDKWKAVGRAQGYAGIGRARRWCGNGWYSAAGLRACQAWRLTWRRCVCARDRGGWKRGTRRSDRSSGGNICRAWFSCRDSGTAGSTRLHYAAFSRR